jgi:Rrf2 family protein
MRLSAKAEYACVAMAELAVRHGQRLPTSLKVIADAYQISQPFLMQIFLQLKGARLVSSVRGATGGYQLARPPEEIELLEVVNVIDGPSGESSALDALPASPLVRGLRQVWKEVQRAERAVLAEITLADLARRMREAGALDFQI